LFLIHYKNGIFINIMENNKLIRIAQKLSLSIKDKSVVVISRKLNSNKGPYEQMMSVLEGWDFVKLVFLISTINNGEKEFESILWRLSNDGFTYAIADVFDDQVQERCDYCGGDGDVGCTGCDGSGEEECSECNGNGEDGEGETCEICDGSGKKECDTCGGRGTEDCWDCGGTGDQQKSDAYEIKLDIYFSINEELKSELSELNRYDKIDSDTITDYVDTNETILVYVLPMAIEVETNEDLEYNTEYFYEIDTAGWVGGTANKLNFDLDY
jgi:hypothetical protein